jgi:cyclase
MKKTVFLWMILFLVFIAGIHAYGQQAAQPQYEKEAAPVSVHKISTHVFEVRGGDGANCSFIVGERGVFVIDAKMSAKTAREMTAVIKHTTNKPISYVILTHSDGDHVDGLTGFSGRPDIIAHVNCAKDIEKVNENKSEKLPLPNETFDGRMNIYSGRFHVELLYFGPAHTDGDAVILVPDDKVAIVGDLFFKGMDPIIHSEKNGNSFGLANVLARIAELDAQTYLSGHSEPVTREDIDALRKNIVETQNRVKNMFAENKTLDEVKKALGVSAEQGRWPSLVEIIFQELANADKAKH